MCVCACVCYMQAVDIWRIHLPSLPITGITGELSKSLQFQTVTGGHREQVHEEWRESFHSQTKKKLGKPQLPHWYYCMTPTSQILNSRACLYNSCTWTKTYMYIITSKFHLRNHIECHIDRLSFILPGFCLCSFLCHPRYRSWVLPNQQFFSCSHGQNKNLLTQGRVSFNKLDRTSDAAFHG